MTSIKDLSLLEIENYLLEKNEPRFRAKQIYEWLWKKNVSNFEDMKNIPADLIKSLKTDFSIENLKIADSKQSKKDKTTKYVFKTIDDYFIEGVLIPSSNNKRVTACISTQIGCPLKCKFCATGTMGFKRNLFFSEIYEQTFLLNEKSKKHFDRKLTNIVVMGMGEPLLNLNNLLKAINLIISKNGLAISPTRITVSTVGLTKQIKQLADFKPKFNLALSLHTARNKQRNKIMPVNIKNSVPELIKALKYFYKKTNQRITFEYLMINGITDTKDDAKALAEFCKNFPSKINLIKYNSVEHIDFRGSTTNNMRNFYEFLLSKNLIVTIRQSKGQDIEAACGQLVRKKIKD